MERKELINLLYIGLLILGVISLGLLALNQAMTWIYKSEFLQQPCDLCQKLNKDMVCKNEIKIDPRLLNFTYP